MATDFSEIGKKISKAKDIALYCHTNPDGDALGSLLALYTMLKAKGKDVYAFCDTEIVDKYKFMRNIEFVSFPDKRTHELGLSVDCSDIDRLGQCLKSFVSCKTTIAIDHHKSFQNFADISYIERETSSCSEIVYLLSKENKWLTKESAELLFTGMVTDTGCFAFDSVTSRTYKIASEILELYKINHADIIYKAYRSTSFDRYNLKIKGLSTAKFYNDNQVAIVVFTNKLFEETNTSINETEGIIAELINIDRIKVAYAISEVNPRNYKLSIRTKEGIDASEIAAQFGGGGHKAAAGCRVNGYLEDIMEKLIKLANDRI